MAMTAEMKLAVLNQISARLVERAQDEDPDGDTWTLVAQVEEMAYELVNAEQNQELVQQFVWERYGMDTTLPPTLAIPAGTNHPAIWWRVSRYGAGWAVEESYNQGNAESSWTRHCIVPTEQAGWDFISAWVAERLK